MVFGRRGRARMTELTEEESLVKFVVDIVVLVVVEMVVMGCLVKEKEEL